MIEIKQHIYMKGMKVMGKLESAEKIGLKDKASNKILAVYPYKATGTDAEIIKIVGTGIINKVAQLKINS